jgi:Tfp pilus assembly protein PilF
MVADEIRAASVKGGMRNAMKISDVLYRLIGVNRPSCPNEADILAYSENRLSSIARSRLESHLAGCEDCREILVFMGREVEKGAPISAEAVSKQTARVLGAIRDYEHGSAKDERRVPVGFVPRFSVPRLATVGLVMCAVLIAGIYLVMSNGSRPDAAMEALRLAVKDKRSTPLRVSGNLEYSAYSVKRGDDRDNTDLQFSRALLKLKSAEEETAPPSDRLVLARIYLSRGKLEDSKRALEILSQMEARGVETAESLNDTGVAYFQLRDNSTAIDYFSRSLAKSPAYIQALFNRAVAEQGANRLADARKDWEQFLVQSKDEKWNAEAEKRLKTLGDTNSN